jgi:hypothetical protein
MDSTFTGNYSTGRLRMETYIFLAESFIDLCLLVIIFVFAPDFFKDVRKMWKENRKSSTEGKSAERDKIKHSNYNISKKRKINNLERWE